MTLDGTRSSNQGNYGKASSYALLGEKDKAFAELDKLYENREFGVLLIKVEPTLDSLRDDPRFQELLRKIGFPQ